MVSPSYSLIAANAWYFLYACYIGGWTLAIMVLNGTFYQYFPNEPLLMARVMPVVLSAIVFTLSLFGGFWNSMR